MKEIFTLGTSNRSISDFGEILKQYRIAVLLDVRRFPKSRFQHFIGEHLERYCRERGIEYLWLGDCLGGFRTGGYEQYMNTDDFHRAIVEVEQHAGKHRCVLLCAEKFPGKCHRRFIGRRLEERGWEVVHIIDQHTVWEPAPELFHHD